MADDTGGTQPGAATVTPSPDATKIDGSGETVMLPQGFTFGTAEFEPSGADLVLTAPDGKQVVIENFFDGGSPPDIQTPEGGTLSGEVATRLAGSQTAGQVAQAGPAAQAEPIGQVENISGTVTAIRADGTRVELQVGDPVFQGDILESGENGSVGVVLADETTFSMAEGGRMVLDEMVYDPGTQEGSISMSVLQGVFTFVSGQVAKVDPDAMVLNTPVATIGIRGTQVAIDMGDGTNMEVVLMTEADGFVGEVVVSNSAGVQILNAPDQGTNVENNNTPPSQPRTLERSEIAENFGSALEQLPTSVGTGNNYGVGGDVEEEEEAVDPQDGGEEEEAVSTDDEDEDDEELSDEDLNDLDTASGEEEPGDDLTPAQDPVAAEDPEDAPDLPGVGDDGGNGGTIQPASGGPGGGPAGDDPVNPENPQPNITPTNSAPDAVDDAFSLDEDSALTIDPADLLSNDSDLDGGSLSVIAVFGAQNGTVELVDGEVIFTPAANYSGPAQFTYQISDGQGGTDTAVVNLTINSENDDPVAVNDAFSLDEDNALTIDPADLLSNDSDLDGGTLVVTGVSDATNGTVEIVNGEVVFTPAANYNGPAQFTYEISDGQGGTDTAVVNLTVNSVNDEPVAVNDAFSLDEDNALTIEPADLLANDSDLDGGTLVVTGVSGATNGTVEIVNGEVVFTPAANYNGPAQFTYEISDGQGGTATAVVNLTVDPANDNPVAITNSIQLDEDVTLNSQLEATDIDGDELTFSLAEGGAPAHGTVTINADGSFTFVPEADYNGSDSFTYQVSDGAGGVVTQVVTVGIDPENDEPVAVTNSIQLDEDATLTSQLEATDIDGDELTFSLAEGGAPAHGTVTINADGSFTFVPEADYNGDDSFTYQVSDGAGGIVTQVVTVGIDPQNDDPVAVNDAFTLDEDNALIIDPVDLLTNDTDIDEDNLEVISVSGATNGTVEIINGEVVFTPALNYNGPAQFTYEIEDGAGGTATATVNLTIDPANDDPVAITDAIQVVEDTAFTSQLQATDIDDDTLTFSLAEGGGPDHGTLTINPDGSFTYTPETDYEGTDSFTYQVDDGAGGVTTQLVTVTMDATNDEPVAVTNQITLDEDATLNSQLTASDVDTPIEDLTFSLASGGAPAHGTVTINADGTFTFVPEADYNGADSFTYQVDDGAGGVVTQVVTVGINPQNDAPVALGDAFSLDEDNALTIDTASLLSNDTDIDGDNLSVISVSGATNGTVAIVNGEVVFTPAANYNGPAEFTYEISDGQGGTDTAIVTLTINAGNDEPVAVADAFTLDEDNALTIDPTDLVTNDFDIDEDNLEVISVSGATNGTVAIVDGEVVFTPAANYNGPAQFTYEISDGQGGTDTAVVNLTINPVNDDPVAVADSFTLDEDAALTIDTADLLSNDNDLDGDSLSVISVSGATNGTVAIVNGDVVFTPAANYNGPAQFTYEISDGAGGTDTAVVNLTIDPTNDDPVAVADAFSLDEDNALTIDTADLLSNDSDLDGDSLSVISVSGATNGTVAIVNGEVVFTPAANYNGPAQFTYQISDNQGGTDTAVVNLTINSVNDDPVAVADSFGLDEDNALTIDPADLLANDSDLDGGTLVVTGVSGATNGTVEIVNGEVVFTPAANYHGPAEFTYQISDGQGGTDTAVVSLTVNSVNDEPVAVNDAFILNEDNALTIDPADLLANDSDLDGGTLVVTGVSGATNGTVEIVNGEVVFTPAANYNGPAQFTYEIADGQGGTDTAVVNLTVNSVNDDPVAVNDAFSLDEDNALTIDPADLLANDSDLDGDSLSVISVSGATNGTVEIVDGEVVFTPVANYNGPAQFTYEISDGQGGTDTAVVNLTVNSVNDEPVAVNDAFTLDEDNALTIDPVDLLSNDSDLDGDTLIVTGVSGATNGTVEIVDGEVVFTPAANYNGPAQFTYEISDGQGGTSTAVVNLTIDPVNDNPVAVADAFTLDEDKALTIDPTDLLANDTDIDEDNLEVISVSGATNGTVEIINGEVVFTPAANYNGPAQFTYEISDGAGGTSTAVVNLTIDPVNDNPVAVADAFTLDEDNALTIDPTDLLANDTDIDEDNLEVISVSGATNGTVEIINGEVVFTPAANYNGPAQFTYEISDGQGGTSTATVNLTIDPINDAPVAVADAFTLNEDNALTIDPADLLANDTDIDEDNLEVVSVSGAINGTVEIVNGEVVFTPAVNYNGPAQFTYEISDGQGGTSTAVVNLTIDPTNDAPVAVNDAFTLNEDNALTIDPTDLLANDTDIDEDNLEVISVSGATNGTVEIVNGEVVFTPAANYNGPAQFTYEISDGQGGTDTAVVNLTINSINDEPVAVNDAFSLDEDNALTIDPADLLANDSDLDGGTLVVIGVSGATNGTVEIVNGEVVFTPAANYNGPAQFTYEISDGQGGTDTAVVNLTVNSVNDEPVAVGDSFILNEDNALTIDTADLLSNDSDLDGGTLVITGVSAATNGTVELVNGAVVFTPAANYNGPAQFAYEISDGQGGTDTAVVNLTINAVNDEPVAVADAFNLNEDNALTIDPADLLANDTDIDEDNLEVISVSGATNGTVEIVNGEIVFTPAADYNGPAQFTYEISDGAGGTSTATVSLTINPQNDDPVAITNSIQLNEDATLTSQLEATDIDGDDLTFSLAEGGAPAHGTVTINPDGSFSFVPEADYNGADSFTYQVSDGQGGVVTQVVTVGIDPQNDDPVAVTNSILLDEDATLNSQLEATDIDGDDLTFSLAEGGAPAHGTVTINGDGSFSFVPEADYNGTDSFTYQVSDGAGGVVTQVVSVGINPMNDDPVALGDAFSLDEDNALTIDPADLLTNDSDIDGDNLSVTAVSGATNGTVEIVNGEVVFTPAANYNGPAQFTYEISDGQGGTDTAVVNLTINSVNDDPVAVTDAFSLDEDNALTIDPADLLANDSDLDGGILILTGVSGATNGSVAIVNGEVVFTPAANYNGPAQFTYQISDGQGGTATAVVNLTVDAANDVPVAVTSAIQLDEDSSHTAQLQATDIDGDNLTFSQNTDGAFPQPQHGTITISPDGSFTYTPEADYNGTDSFTYQVSDGQGGVVNQTVTVTVDPLNDDPVAIVDTATVGEDEGNSVSGDIFANDSDVDGDTLSLIEVTFEGQTFNFPEGEDTLTVEGDNGTLTIKTDGSYNYERNDSTETPGETIRAGGGRRDDADDWAADGVSISAFSFNSPYTDGNNQFDASLADANATFTRDGVGVSGSQGNAQSAGQIEFDSASGESEALAMTFNTPVSEARITVDRLYRNEGSTGEQGKWEAFDAEGNLVGSGVINDSTVDYYNSNEGELTVNLNGVSFQTIVFTATEMTGSESDFNIRQIEYDTVPGDLEPDVFGYTVSDGQGGTDTASLTIDIGDVGPNVNSDGTSIGPDAVADAFSLDEDNALTIDPADLLANDSDLDGGTVVVTAVSGATNGAVEIVNGEVVFTPAANYNGPAQFTYQISDGQGGTATAVVNLTINSVNDVPVAVTSAIQLDEDSSHTAQLQATDIDGGNLTFSQNTDGAFPQPQHGTITISPDGSFTYTPEADYNGTDSFTYQVSDGQGGVVNQTVTVTVDQLNDNPVAVADSATVGEDEGNTVSDNVLSDDSDVDGDTLSLIEVTFEGQTFNFPEGEDTLTVEGDNGTLTIKTDGSYSYERNDATETPSETIRAGGGRRDDADDWADDGVSISAFSFDSPYTDGNNQFDASLADANASFTRDGVGVSGSQGNAQASSQIEFDSASGESEALAMTFDTPVSEARITVDRLYHQEGSTGEQGKWEAFDAEGNLVGSGVINDSTVDYDNSNEGELTVNLNGVSFQTIVFTATAMSGSESDFNIRQIEYDTAPVALEPDVFGYTVSDGEGGTDTGSLAIGIGDVAPHVTADGTPIDNSDDSETSVGTDGDDVPEVDYNVVQGGEGDDFLVGSTGQDDISGGEGDDYLFAGSDDDLVSGGEGDDFISASAGDDTVSGGEGDDIIYAGADDDEVSGGEGDDFISASSGDDTVSGGEGDDYIFGGDGIDYLQGDGGGDVIYGGDDKDVIIGGEGDDDLVGGDGDDEFIFNIGDGEDSVWDFEQGDQLTFEGITEDDISFEVDGDDVVINVIGQDGKKDVESKITLKDAAKNKNADERSDIEGSGAGYSVTDTGDGSVHVVLDTPGG